MAWGGRTAGWVALSAILIAIIWGLYELIEGLAEVGPQLAASRFVLTILTIAITVLALGLAGVLIRNLVRLIVERKRGILGAKLRTKLVFFFLALVLVPALLISWGAAAVIRKNVNALLKTPVEEVVVEARTLAHEWRRVEEQRYLRQAGSIARQVEPAIRGGKVDEVPAIVERERRGAALELVVVTMGTEPVGFSLDPSLIGEGLDANRHGERSDRLIALVIRSGRPRSELDKLGDDLLLLAAAPIRPIGQVAGQPPSGVVVVGAVLSDALLSRVDRIASSAELYRRFRGERRELLRLYYSIITLIGLATVFVASWIGFYLSRRITVPIQELAAASREISAGNLGVRVRSATGDEVGMLVEAFNEMAAQLQESREVITRSTADLRRSNEALDERRRYVETLVANLSTAVLSLDPEGRVTTANPAVETILGIRLSLGEPLLPRLGSTDLEPLRTFVEEVVEREDAERRRELVLTGSGRTTTVAVQISPLKGGRGEDLGTLVMVEDLSELLRAQKAAAWREVARRIAHEIKNPLTPIQLATQRLRKKFAEGAADLGQVLPDATASIEREVGALKRLVDEFSGFARMPEVSLAPVEFPRVVDSVLALYQGMTAVEWKVEIDPAMGAVKVDAEQMRRVLINLIENSVAAMNGKGEIRILVGQNGGKGGLRIEVCDSGPGIPPGDRDKLFMPYFSTRRHGTGLGLAIVYRVVTDHRGTIRVEDNDPHGARFVIEIPA